MGGQLHLKEEASKAEEPFEADDICIFDPSAYYVDWDNEVTAILRQKAEMLQQRFDEQKRRSTQRLADLTEQLQSTRFIVNRKDMLLEGLMQKHGYKNEKTL